MTRAATSPEVTKYASDGQWSDLFAYIPVPAVVLACRVNQATVEYDKLSQLTFDGVTTGAYGDILAGMTVLVGSAAGLSDRGIGYARKAADSTTLYLGETAEISAVDNDCITVLRDFGLWLKPARALADATGTLYINHDEAYAAQMGTRKAIITAGGDRVLELTGANVAATYALSGSSTYVTTCAGSTVTNGTTDHPTVTITAAGDYLVKIVATAANATVTTTYRWIYVVSAAAPGRNIILTDDSADATGWNAHIQLYENTSTIRDRAKVVLYARDYYGNVLGSIGSLAGCENIVTTGWVDGKTIVYDVDNGSVEFDVKPASWWLDQIPNPLEIKVTQVTGTPANWAQMASLTVDKMLWHVLENYTTALNSMDAILTGDARTATSMTAPVGSLWSQITAIADGKIKALSFVNQYGQLIFTIDTPLIPIASRSGIPVVVTLTKDDFEDITVDVLQVNPNAQLIITGQLADGTTIASIGGGHVLGHYGTPNEIPNLMAYDQPTFNELAGSLLERDNCPYKFSIKNLRGNNRLIEPGNRIGLTLTGSDNLAGLAYSGYAIVRTVSRSHDPATAGNNIDLDADAETQAIRYRTGEVPVDTGSGIVWVPFPTLPPYKLPGFGTFPGIPPVMTPPPDPSLCTDGSPADGPFTLSWDRAWIDGGSGVGTGSTTAWKKCTIRSATATHQTLINFNMGIKTSDLETRLHVVGIDGAGNTVATGTLVMDYFGGPYYASIFHATFSEVSAVTVAGFKLYMDPGYIFDTSLPLYQGNRGDADGWDVALEGDVSGATTTLDACVRTVYDPTNGHVGYAIRADGYGNWGFASPAGFKFNTHFNWSSHSYGGATGKLYAYLAWLSTTSNPTYPMTSLYQDATSFVYNDLVNPGSTFTGIYNAIDVNRNTSYLVPPDLRLIGLGTSITPHVNYSNILVIDIYYAADGSSYTYPIATPSAANLYNVCE